MKIAFVTSEAAPFAKTGGLADVSGSLPKELAAQGCSVKVFLPKYDIISDSECQFTKLEEIDGFNVRVDQVYYPVSLYTCKCNESNIEFYFIEQESFFHRGKLYTEDPDEHKRFIFFQKAVIETLQHIKWAPDIIHCNDWQTGLIPMFLKYNYSWDRMFEKTSTIFTIHNIGYQGVFDLDTLEIAEIDNELFYSGGPAEFYGKVSFLKLGITLADVVNTVSFTYAKELLTPEFGAGMEGILESREDSFYGILNGVDYKIWNPETDPLIPFNYSADNLKNKLKNKKYLLKKFDMPFRPELPLIGMVSRIVSQKGFDILAEAVQYLVRLPAQWIILGKGEHKYENKIIRIAKQYPDYIKANLFYNNEYAHLVEAGSDIFLMPSHYEPCGLNQIYSLKYGSVPVVRRTGGLADTIIDWDENLENGKTGNGFVFDDYNGYELYSSVKRAIKCFKNKHIWNNIVKNAMKADFSWEKSAEHYIQLYQKALSEKNSKKL